jgi:hypothetical protein
MDLRENFFFWGGVVDWIHLAQGRVSGGLLWKLVMSLRVP